MTGENQVENVDVNRGNAKRIRRYWRFAILSFAGLVLCILGVFWWKSGLNETERRFLGVWTWQDSPGEMTCHYREDGTMSYAFAPNNTILDIKKWKVDANVISFERFERNPVKLLVKKMLHKNEQYRVTPNADGSIAFESNDGKVKVLIPWSRVQGQFPRQSE